jgi:hypothetical protein
VTTADLVTTAGVTSTPRVASALPSAPLRIKQTTQRTRLYRHDVLNKLKAAAAPPRVLSRAYKSQAQYIQRGTRCTAAAAAAAAAPLRMQQGTQITGPVSETWNGVIHFTGSLDCSH